MGMLRPPLVFMPRPFLTALKLWADYLKPRGYRIRYQIIEFPGGVPGDIAITIAWGD